MANKKQEPKKMAKVEPKKSVPKKKEEKKDIQEGLNDAQKISDVIKNKAVS